MSRAPCHVAASSKTFCGVRVTIHTWDVGNQSARASVQMIAKCLFVGIYTTACFGQHLEAGVKGGIPVSSAFETGSFFTLDFGEAAFSSTRRYTIGPMVGLRLPHGLGVEVDALYSRLGFDDLTKSAGVFFSRTRTIAGSWEFPIIGKYHFGSFSALSPYVDGGVSFRHLGGVSTTTEQFIDLPGYGTQVGASGTFGIDRSNHGGVVGFGLEVHAGILRISPELRYTRWGADSNLDHPQLHSNQNQVSLLVGIAF